MRLELIERNYDIGARLATIFAKKISKLDKYFPDDAKARVVCKQENKTFKLELTITSKGLLYRGEVIGENMYENIDLVLPKIERQILRESGKKRDSFKKGAFEDNKFEFVDEMPALSSREIIKKKTFDLSPITIEDAKVNLEDVDHDFYVFLNAETGKVNVLYKRLDNELGLIELNY